MQDVCPTGQDLTWMSEGKKRSHSADVLWIFEKHVSLTSSGMCLPTCSSDPLYLPLKHQFCTWRALWLWLGYVLENFILWVKITAICKVHKSCYVLRSFMSINLHSITKKWFFTLSHKQDANPILRRGVQCMTHPTPDSDFPCLLCYCNWWAL